MKTRTKNVLLLTVCAVALVAASIAGTIAYFTWKGEVTNTFTVGKINMELEEIVDPITSDPYVKPNDLNGYEYKLVPGHTYPKHAHLAIDKDSESAWLFFKMENGIADIESNEEGYKNIATQITENGWTALDGVEGVYYCLFDAEKAEEKNDFVIIDSFTVDPDLEDLSAYEEATIKITAYAIQEDGFDTPAAAWAALQTAEETAAE